MEVIQLGKDSVLVPGKVIMAHMRRGCFIGKTHTIPTWENWGCPTRKKGDLLVGGGPRGKIWASHIEPKSKERIVVGEVWKDWDNSPYLSEMSGETWGEKKTLFRKLLLTAQLGQRSSELWKKLLKVSFFREGGRAVKGQVGEKTESGTLSEKAWQTEPPSANEACDSESIREKGGGA